MISTTTVRVREAFGLETVLVEEVGGFGRPDSYFSLSSRMVKSSNMAMAGVDSFWKVSGERAENHVLLKHQKRYRAGSKSQSYSAYIHKSQPPLINQNSTTPGLDVPAGPNPEHVTYRNEMRLEAGYSHPLGHHSKTLSMLMGDGLPIRSKHRLIAVEIADGFWLKGGQLKQIGNLLFALEQQKNAVVGQRLLHEPQTIDAGGGLVVFLDALQWSEAILDCRSEDEISSNASLWLQKLTVFDGQTRSPDDLRQAVNTLQSLLAGSANQDEFADLAIAIRAAQAKPQLSRLLPELLRNDTYWHEQVQTTIEKAVALKKGEIDAAFADELAQKEARLGQLMQDVADAERRLSSAEERERAYRAGSEEVRKLIEEQVSAVTRDVFEPALKTRLQEIEDTSELKSEVDKLAARLSQVEQTADTAVATSKVETAKALEPKSIVRISDSRDQRSLMFQDLAERTSIGTSKLAFVLARMFAGGFPVLAGDHADVFALEICALLGGNASNVIFCDPTKVTFRDLLDDIQLHGSLAGVIEIAEATPNAFVPLILCGLTKAPCEFWLPALLDGRRTGALPKNLVLLGTVAPDGIRIEIPRSLLRRIEPLELTGSDDLPLPSKFGAFGLWPVPDQSLVSEHRITAIDVLTSFEADGRAIGEAINSLSVVLGATDCNAANIAQSFAHKQEWMKSLRETSSDKHALHRYFANFEG